MRSYRDYTDRQLTTLLASSEGSAVFSEIYERYWERLLAIAFYHAKHRTVAEEIVQEIFVRLWQRRTSLVIGDLGAYLATACKFMVFKYYAREKHRSELLEQHMALSSADVDQDELIAARFLEEYLHGIVEQLPDKCKIVYQLKTEEGLSMAQIGQRLSISSHTARNHLAKARSVIRASLKEAGHIFSVFL